MGLAEIGSWPTQNLSTERFTVLYGPDRSFRAGAMVARAMDLPSSRTIAVSKPQQAKAVKDHKQAAAHIREYGHP